MPSYNSNVVPQGLVYNSAVADPQPVFLVNDPLGSSLPSSVTAQLTIKDLSNTTTYYSGPTVYYKPYLLNPYDTMAIALHERAHGRHRTV